MGQVLRDEIDLDGALRLEELRLSYDIRQCERSVPSAHERNRTERATVIAPFTDLEVANVGQISREEPDSRMNRRHIVDQPALVKLGDQPIDLRGAKEEIDFRQRLDKLVFVPLNHASDANDSAAGARLLESSRLDERIDRFLLGGVYKPARVHDDDLGLIEVRRELRATVGELSDVALAVDRILVAA